MSLFTRSEATGQLLLSRTCTAGTSTCLLSDTSWMSSCRMVTTPESWEADSAVMSACSRCMPLGGRRRALSGWWRYWAPMLSFLTGPERLGVALSEPPPPPPLGFCLTACTREKKVPLFLEVKNDSSAGVLGEEAAEVCRWSPTSRMNESVEASAGAHIGFII